MHRMERPCIEWLIGTREQLAPDLFAALAAYRYEVFVRTMGWQLPYCRPGCEQDQFDTEHAVYVICLHESGEVSGCGRLLPTTRPYLVEHIFPFLVASQALPHSSEIWELSRFSAASLVARRLPSGLSESLFEACLQTAGQYGGKSIIGVLSVAFERWCRSHGIQMERLGSPQTYQRELVVACSVAVPHLRPELPVVLGV
jgi:acyl homoserine lactone synthase